MTSHAPDARENFLFMDQTVLLRQFGHMATKATTGGLRREKFSAEMTIEGLQIITEPECATDEARGIPREGVFKHDRPPFKIQPR